MELEIQSAKLILSIVDKETGGLKTLRPKTIPCGVIFTMNCPREWMEKYNYPTILEDNVNCLNHIFGYAESLYSCDTYQFIDYSKYDIDLFDEKHKAKVRDEQFPIDLENAFEIQDIAIIEKTLDEEREEYDKLSAEFKDIDFML